MPVYIISSCFIILEWFQKVKEHMSKSAIGVVCLIVVGFV